ncbi:uncharacterized protein LTR77_004112 [Saxophila tyrrhenica]|uniref:Uncharacterized protein n=1 Tax=Saxophila tyrrhenica TaxID=1690608 RepID=A0AAV9PG21_9PEZI|nr:hypothetical protein LTR77_004112 [Saxophila tyrrhenica]
MALKKLKLPQHPQTQIGFFTLPAELRNKIYALALTLPANDAGCVETIPMYEKYTNRQPSFFSILQTWQAVYHEARGLVSTINHFQLCPPYSHVRLVRSYSAGALTISAAAFKTVTAVMDAAWKFPWACSQLRSCSGLQRLQLQLRNNRLFDAFGLDRGVKRLRIVFLDDQKSLQAAAQKLPSSLRLIEVSLQRHDILELPEAIRAGWQQEYESLEREVCGWIAQAYREAYGKVLHQQDSDRIT